MPIYEYLCEACGTLTERMQKVSDPPPGKCPECGSRKIARMISRTSFRLKGGGWYADLYSSPDRAGTRKGAAKEKGGAPASKPEGAPGAKGTAAPAGGRSNPKG